MLPKLPSFSHSLLSLGNTEGKFQSIFRENVNVCKMNNIQIPIIENKEKYFLKCMNLTTFNILKETRNEDICGFTLGPFQFQNHFVLFHSNEK